MVDVLKHETSQRILVVDDEETIRYLVRDKLELAGYEVLTADSGGQALQIIQRHGLPHLAILDITMPGMDGFELCQALQQYADLPIVFLTAIDEEETVVKGIEQYAEDYITKPFSPRELVSRVRRILSRVQNFAYALEQLVQIDERLRVNFTNRELLVEDEPISLTPIETKLLYILIQNAGQIVLTDFLLQRLWPREDVFADTLRVHVHRLRHKIEQTPSDPKYILTERGKGYSFPLLK